ncbi:MAG TPA: PAS domain-containing protein [Azonexus sp.]
MSQQATPPATGTSAPAPGDDGLRLADAALSIAEQLGELFADAVVVLDSQGHIIRVSAAFTRLFGYSAEEIRGRAADALHGADSPQAPAPGSRAGMRCRHRNGELFDADLACLALPASTGGPAGTLLVYRRLEASGTAAAVDDENELRALFALSLVGTTEADPATGRLLKVNRRMCEITGYSQDELQAMTFRDLTHPEDRDSDWEGFRRTMTGNAGLYVVEKRYVRKDLRVIWVRVQSAPLRDQQGVALRTIAQVQDITLQRQSEEALRRQLELQGWLTKILATVPGVICSYRLRPDGGLCLPYASAGLEQLFGLRPETLRDDAAPLLARIHGDDRRHVDASIAASLAAMAPWRAEFRVNHPQRGELWLEGHSVPQREPDGSVLWHGYLTDISVRKQMEQALRDSEADLRRAQAVARTGSWHLNVQKNELLWSDENHRIFGIPRGTPLTYESFLAIAHPQDREFVDRSWQAACLGAPYDIEHRIIVGGEIRWVRERAELEFDADGNLLGGFGSTQDVTELKHSAAALAASESRFRLAMKAVAGVVYDWNRQSGATYWSSGLSRVFGVAGMDAEASRSWWRDSVHPEDLPRIRQEILQARKARSNQVQLDYRMRHRDGHWLHISDCAHIVRDHRGMVERVVGSLTDISARKHAEAGLRQINDSLETQVAQRTAEAEARAVALQESERFARATIDALDFALCVLDERGCIVAVNKAWREFARFNGGHLDELCEGADYLAVCDAAAALANPGAAQVAAALRAALAGGDQNFSVEYDSHSPEERRWFVMRMSAFPSDGPLRLVIKHEDITARKQSEELRLAGARRIKRLAAHLESAREEQSATIAREVHDELGGTLTMVKLGLAMIGDAMDPSAPQHEALDRVLQQVSTALQTVKRISANLRPATLDTLGFIATIKWYAAQFSQMTGIATELHLPEYVGLSRHGATAAFRIVQEALTNVAKHARASRVMIRIERDAGQLAIEIKDDGIGVTEANQSKLESFGLIGMLERARDLGGQLHIAGTPGAGTRLTLRIPLINSGEDWEYEQ